MNTLIVYSTIHGSTKKCAIKLSKFLMGNITIINLKDTETIDLNNFSTVIIGGSIHTGHINPRIQLFCNKYENELISKNIGVFLCFMDPISKGDYYFNKSFSEKLRQKIKVKGYFGGEFDFNKLTFFEQLFIKKTTNINCSVSKIIEQNIHSFGTKMNAFISSN